MRYLLPVILFLLSYCFHDNALASPEKEELTIATYIEPPFTDIVNNEFVGINIDIVKLIARKLDFKPVFVRCPFARCLSLVEQGKLDMIMGLRKLPEREKSLIFIHPPYVVQHYPLRFFTLASKNTEINSFDDLKKLTVGVLRGGTYFDSFDNNTDITKVELTTREQLVNMLLKGRIDTFLEREQSVIPLLPKEVYQHQFSLASYQYNGAEKTYLAISKNSAVIKRKKEISSVLSTLIAEGTITAIYAQYSIN